MKSIVLISISIVLVVAPPAFAQSSENVATSPLSDKVQAAQRKVASDQAAIDSATQAFKKDLAQLRTDELSGNTAAAEADQTRLEATRAVLNAAREALQKDTAQLRKEAAAEFATDKTAVENTLAKLKADKNSTDIDSLYADIAALQKAYDQAQAHRRITGISSIEEQYSADIPAEVQSATELYYQQKIVADQNAINADKQAIMLDTEQLKADQAAGNASAVEAGQAKLEENNEKLLADENILREDRQRIGLEVKPQVAPTDNKPIIMSNKSTATSKEKKFNNKMPSGKSSDNQALKNAPKKKLNSKLGSGALGSGSRFKNNN